MWTRLHSVVPWHQPTVVCYWYCRKTSMSPSGYRYRKPNVLSRWRSVQPRLHKRAHKYICISVKSEWISAGRLKEVACTDNHPNQFSAAPVRHISFQLPLLDSYAKVLIWNAVFTPYCPGGRRGFYARGHHLTDLNQVLLRQANDLQSQHLNCMHLQPIHHYILICSHWVRGRESMASMYLSDLYYVLFVFFYVVNHVSYYLLSICTALDFFHLHPVLRLSHLSWLIIFTNMAVIAYGRGSVLFVTATHVKGWWALYLQGSGIKIDDEEVGSSAGIPQQKLRVEEGGSYMMPDVSTAATQPDEWVMGNEMLTVNFRRDTFVVIAFCSLFWKCSYIEFAYMDQQMNRMCSRV